jgi:hypothetical protein
MAATRWRSHGCGREATNQRLRRQGGGIVLMAERPSTALRRRQGCKVAIQPTRRWRTTASSEELRRKLQQGQPEQIKPQGRDPLGGARWRWRRLEARTTNPHGQEEAHGEAEQMRHRAAAELAGACRNRARGSSVIRNRQRGIRVRTRPSGGASEGRPAGPSRFGQAHSSWLTGGPRLSA